MILITTATRWESQPLVRAWGLGASGKGVYRGKQGGDDVVLVETGMGMEKTRVFLAAFSEKPALVLSVGFSGALQEGMRSGDLVADPHGAPLELVEAARKAAAGVAPIHMGRMISVSEVLADPSFKRALGESKRAVAVDMESTAVRQWAGERGTDFAALRVVLDAVDQRLPQNVPEDTDSAWPLVRYALGNAGELPLMLGLFFVQRKAIRNLRVFLERFLTASRGIQELT